ncbi:SDR family NAD(P)-dependent oxidoreductase [Anaerolineae bacterium CFX9]|nr:SDR family NAD(P)-dependent oxidoreductase [Anaerolineae bacterium CFX9]
MKPAYPDRKVVLITGASSGIGRSIAAHLAGLGYCVYGTSRQPDAHVIEGVTLLPLEITNDDSVRDCVAAVLARAGRIDVLINNAGGDLVGALEETSLDDARWIFDVNFFGAVRMVQAVLPHMRARRSGQIINISSALGLAAWPFEGFYCASKYALEGYTESLCYEMNLFGIRVSSVQPGFFKSNMIARAREAGRALPDYASARARSMRLNHTWAKNAPDPLPVAQTVQRIIESEKPRLRYAVGLEAHLAPPLAHLLPLSVRFKVGRWLLGVDDPRRDLARWSWRGALIAALSLLALRWRRR